jgi:hypothetical protein
LLKTNTVKPTTDLLITLAFIAGIFLQRQAIAQAPEKMSYQAIIRNNSDKLVTNQPIGMQISILQGSSTGTAVYIEQHYASTNANGLICIEIGGGTVVSGNFATIDWVSGTYYIKTETDPSGGANFTITGTSQILSVPYALHTKTAETADYDNLTNRPTFALVATSGSYNDLTNKPTLFDGNYNSLTNKPTLFNGTWISLTGKPTTLSGYGITDALSTSHTANGITSTNISNWNTAYSWGNHSSMGYAILPPQTDQSGKFLTTNGTTTSWVTLATVAKTGSYNDLTNKPINVSAFTNDAGYLTSISVPNQTAGDIIYYNGNTWVRLPKGTDGQILILNKGLPTWQNASALFSPMAPTAFVQDASDILENAATLNGNVNANGYSTTVIFEYGTTSFDNTVTATQSPVFGNEMTNVSVTINALSEYTTYYFRLKASNAVGVTYSDYKSFTTTGLLPPPPPPPPGK